MINQTLVSALWFLVYGSWLKAHAWAPAMHAMRKRSELAGRGETVWACEKARLPNAGVQNGKMSYGGSGAWLLCLSFVAMFMVFVLGMIKRYAHALLVRFVKCACEHKLLYA